MSEEGHTIKIKKIYEDKQNKTLIVSIRQTDPDEKCPTDKNSTVAMDLVAINKTDWAVNFEVVRETGKCEAVVDSTEN